MSDLKMQLAFANILKKKAAASAARAVPTGESEPRTNASSPALLETLRQPRAKRPARMTRTPGSSGSKH